MVKPDGVERGLVGEILTRFERRGLRLVAGKFLRVPRDLAERHYAEHREKPFYEDLVAFITSGPVFAFVLEGEDAIRVVREMMGRTNPRDAAPGRSAAITPCPSKRTWSTAPIRGRARNGRSPSGFVPKRSWTTGAP